MVLSDAHITAADTVCVHVGEAVGPENMVPAVGGGVPSAISARKF